MKGNKLLILSLIYAASLTAQNQDLDTSAFGKWTTLISCDASNNGKFVAYQIRSEAKIKLIVRNVEGSWNLTLDHERLEFTHDSKRAIVRFADTLMIVLLGTSRIDTITNVQDYKIPQTDESSFIAYSLRNPARQLVVQDFTDGRRTTYLWVKEYLFNPVGNVLAMVRQESDTSLVGWINLPAGKEELIWEGSKCRTLVFDATGQHLAFVGIGKMQNSQNSSLWYYFRRSKLVNEIRVPEYVDSLGNIQLANILGFRHDGRSILFTVKNLDRKPLMPVIANTQIWNYQDQALQSLQSGTKEQARDYLAVADVQNGDVRILESKYDYVPKHHLHNSHSADKYLLAYRKLNGVSDEANWNRSSVVKWFLVSTTGDLRLELPFNYRFIWLSPGNQFIVYFNHTDKNYYSYEITTKKVRNITTSVVAEWTVDADELASPDSPVGIAGWLVDDDGVLVYDRTDLWLVDPKGIEAPVNVTNGFGKKSAYVFRLGLDAKHLFNRKQNLVFTVFDQHTKQNGFYSKQLGLHGDPIKLTMGNYVYFVKTDNLSFGSLYPKGPFNGNSYLVNRESTSASPNYFLTEDFKRFTAITDNYPEKSYRWFTSELHTFKTADGTTINGVLYKPENFDPRKKYPVIVHYYEKETDQLNKFHNAETIGDYINIPWFISQGYLIFTPDIFYEPGYAGECALKSVESAGRYLATLPYVNQKSLGLQGHSFGGYETNYIAAHSDLFAAAVAGSPPVDCISHYGAITEKGDGVSIQFNYEIHQSRIGASLYERPDLYINNTPLFAANQLTTPLLLMLNHNDSIIPFAQGVEWYLALKRLGKKIWFLQYDGESHGLGIPENKMDYTLKMTQFFNHYLKGEQVPQWMLHPVPANMKGYYGIRQ